MSATDAAGLKYMAEFLAEQLEPIAILTVPLTRVLPVDLVRGALSSLVLTPIPEWPSGDTWHLHWCLLLAFGTDLPQTSSDPHYRRLDSLDGAFDTLLGLKGAWVPNHTREIDKLVRDWNTNLGVPSDELIRTTRDRRLRTVAQVIVSQHLLHAVGGWLKELQRRRAPEDVYRFCVRSLAFHGYGTLPEDENADRMREAIAWYLSPPSRSAQSAQ